MSIPEKSFERVRESLATTDPSPITVLWPKPMPLSVLEAGKRFGISLIDQIACNLDLAILTAGTPVVAVAGELNAGKTSLVSCFLSEENRKRLNRGLEPKSATHRFTLWVPESWMADPGRAEAISRELRVVFECEPEPLDSSPARARAQQNDWKRISVPLLATDPSLDEHRIALFDCPDIESEECAEERIQTLRRGSRLCSAQIIVIEHRKLRAKTFGEVIECLPDARTIFAINLVEDCPPGEAAAYFQERHRKLETPIEDIYVAYHFRHKDEYCSFTPTWDPNLQLTSKDDRAPCFFQVSSVPGKNEPGSVEPERSLTYLSRHIRPEEMQKSRQEARAGEISCALDAVPDSLDRQARKLGEKLARQVESFASRIKDRVFPEGLVLTRVVGDSIISAAQAELPRFSKATALLRFLAFRSRRYIQKMLNQFRVIFKKAPTAETRVKGLHSKDLAAAFTEHFSISDGEAKELAREVIKRFVEEDNANLKQSEWRKVLRLGWESTSLKDMVWMVSLLAAAAAMFFLFMLADGGAVALTFAGLFSVKVWLAFHSALRELNLESILDRQLSNFTAVCCDALGLPRLHALKELGLVTDPELAKLPDPTIPERPNDEFPTRTQVRGTVLRIDKERLSEIIRKAKKTLAWETAHEGKAASVS